MNAVELREVSCTFESGRGVEDLRIGLEAGRVVALLGASGSGKSTVLGLIGGTLAPTRGTVTTLGRDVATLRGRDYRELRAQIGVLGQDGNLTPGLRVVHNVLMGNLGRWSAWRALSSLAWPRRADVEQATAALRHVELGERVWAWPDELSGGERQRVALARLAVQRARLWLADEPTAGLDVRLRRSMLDRLIAAAREHDATLIVALHELSLLDADFDRVWGLAGGRLVLDTAADQVSEEDLASLYVREEAR